MNEQQLLERIVVNPQIFGGQADYSRFENGR